mmetsp:Transcript_25394/g.64562  ORF Transcript_25394/g.64562 Transcript_25394/m.64562 type:complete len:264 (-) Transcript_25394:949-1740(-)
MILASVAWCRAQPRVREGALRCKPRPPASQQPHSGLLSSFSCMARIRPGPPSPSTSATRRLTSSSSFPRRPPMSERAPASAGFLTSLTSVSRSFINFCSSFMSFSCSTTFGPTSWSCAISEPTRLPSSCSARTDFSSVVSCSSRSSDLTSLSLTSTPLKLDSDATSSSWLSSPSCSSWALKYAMLRSWSLRTWLPSSSTLCSPPSHFLLRISSCSACSTRVCSHSCRRFWKSWRRPSRFSRSSRSLRVLSCSSRDSCCVRTDL